MRLFLNEVVEPLLPASPIGEQEGTKLVKVEIFDKSKILSGLKYYLDEFGRFPVTMEDGRQTDLFYSEQAW